MSENVLPVVRDESPTNHSNKSRVNDQKHNDTEITIAQKFCCRRGIGRL